MPILFKSSLTPAIQTMDGTFKRTIVRRPRTGSTEDVFPKDLDFEGL